MNRREAGRNLLLGALAIGAAPALAQMPGMGRGDLGPAEQRHATDTLKVGGLALQSSQAAQGKARTPRVREFADFEVAEQTTIAQIIQEATGMAPPPPDRMDQMKLDSLMRTSGRGFEAGYVTLQIDGHQKLLGIQERYLAEGRNPDFRHVAMLARGQIKEHLKLLDDIRSGRA